MTEKSKIFTPIKVKLYTRDLEANETLHVYGDDAKGWEVILQREGLTNGHLWWPSLFDLSKHTLDECLDFIQRGMDKGRKGWGFNCACCGHTTDTNIREMIV
jgi:hypothetical protein